MLFDCFRQHLSYTKYFRFFITILDSIKITQSTRNAKTASKTYYLHIPYWKLFLLSVCSLSSYESTWYVIWWYWYGNSWIFFLVYVDNDGHTPQTFSYFWHILISYKKLMIYDVTLLLEAVTFTSNMTILHWSKKHLMSPCLLEFDSTLLNLHFCCISRGLICILFMSARNYIYESRRKTS